MTYLKQILTALVAITSLVAATGASANTATPAPAGAFTATTGLVSFTLNTVRRTMTCSTSTVTATTAAATGALPLTVASNVQFTFGGPCNLTGGLGITIRCANPASLNATGLTVNGVTSMSLTGISCVAAITASCTVNLGGTVIGYYDNSPKALTIFGFGQTMAATGSSNGSGGACSPLPNDASVTFNANTPPLVYTPSPAFTLTVV
jgi:hypothetical protein